MAVQLVILGQHRRNERRVAATPDIVEKYVKMGIVVTVVAGAGEHAGFSNADYRRAGGKIMLQSRKGLSAANIVLCVDPPPSSLVRKLSSGTLLIGLLASPPDKVLLSAARAAGVEVLALESLPRITRAQSMDVLSSQSNLAGYKAVIDAVYEYGEAMPMMMTAAGTIPAARVFVMGAGVAGLQAIATARRLGAVVSATDVRRAAAEQVESLGAKFVMVDAKNEDSGETKGGYAKQMSAAYRQKQATLIAKHIAGQDIVICTALIPGQPAPELVTKKMIQSMRQGAVLVDLAVAQGGNCKLSRPDQIVIQQGVKIIGYANVPARLSPTTSRLYARNIYNLISAFWNEETKTLNLDWDDEIIAAIACTHGKAKKRTVTPVRQSTQKAKSAKSAVPEKSAPRRAKPKKPTTKQMKPTKSNRNKRGVRK